MRMGLQVKVSCPAGVPLVSRMGLVSRMDPAVVKLLIGGQQEENGLQKKTE